jgi:putative sporulation protein YtaF
MNLPIFTLFEAFMLALAVSMDAFVASFAYGSNKIKIPMLSVQIVTLTCSAILGLSLAVGSYIRELMPPRLTVVICFLILFFLGLIKLLDCVTKSLIRKYSDIKKELCFSLFNFKFLLQLYADPEKADVDCSRTISPIEAASLAIALSLDGIALGFGAAIGNVNGWAVFFCSFLTGGLAVILGCYLGNKMARKLSFNLSWLSGVFLLVLAFMKL